MASPLCAPLARRIRSLDLLGRRQGVALRIGETEIGACLPAVATLLSDRFPVKRQPSVLCIEPRTAAELDELFDAMAAALAAAGIAAPSTKERIDVSGPSASSHLPLASAPRSLAIPLGLAMRGAHLNAVAAGRRRPALLMGIRSRDHASFPRNVDNLVAGVCRAEEVLSACLVREAWEEAGVSAAHLLGVRTHSVLGYACPAPGGVARGTIHVATAILPRSFRPRSVDGSVERFRLLPIMTPGGRIATLAACKPVAALAMAASLLHLGYGNLEIAALCATRRVR